MNLYDRLGGQRQQIAPQRVPQRAPQVPQQTPQQIIAEIKRDPRGALAQANLDIPEGMTDAEQVLNHMLTSGQLNRPAQQMAMRLLGRG